MARDKADGDRLSGEISALNSATTLQLRLRWKALYGTEPPRRASRDLMTRAVAYRIQGTGVWRAQRLHATAT